VLIDVLVNRFDELLNGIVKPIEVLLNVVLDGIAGDPETMAFLGAHGLQCFQAQVHSMG